MHFGFDYRLEGPVKFWAVAAVFLATAWFMGIFMPRLTAGDDRVLSARAEAAVVGLQEDEDGYLHPVVEFAAADGRTVRAESILGSKPASFAPGDTVLIAFNPGNPAEFVIRSSGRGLDSTLLFRGLALLFAIIGGLILAMSVGALYVRFRCPWNEDAWFWWANFLGGLAGAASVAVPFLLCYPLSLWLPDTLGRAPAGLLILFTVIGIVLCPALYFVGRAQLSGRPRWRSRATDRDEGETRPPAPD